MYEDMFEVSASYFDSDALLEPPYRLLSIEGAAGRCYAAVDDDGIMLAPAWHTVADKSLPTNRALIEYYAKLGMAGAKADMTTKAAFGTIMHELFDRLVVDRRIDLSPEGMWKIANSVAKWDNNVMQEYEPSWVHRLQKCVLSFLAFVKEREVVPRAAEIGLFSKKWLFAGRLDLVCEMTFNKKRVLAIVDYKSRSEPYESLNFVAQLYGYKMLWEENFPDMPIDAVFNWHPPDFKKEPTYTLANRTKKPGWDIVPEALSIFHKTNPKWGDSDDSPVMMIRDAVVSITDDPNDYIKHLTRKEYVSLYIGEKNERPDNKRSDESIEATDTGEDKGRGDGKAGDEDVSTKLGPLYC